MQDEFSLNRLREVDSVDTPNITYRHMNVVIVDSGNKLWLGDFTAAEDIDQLKHHRIHTVITAAQGYFVQYDSTITHYTFNLQDIKTQNIMQYFDDATRKIAAGLRIGGVLVHCAAGVSRSTTIVIAYLMKCHSMTFHQALSHCKKCRPEVCPNISFERQLKLYEKALNSKQVLKHSNKLPQMSTTLPDITSLRHKVTPASMRMNMHMTEYNSGGFKPKIKPKHQSRGWTPAEKTSAYLRKIAEFRFGITSLGRGNNHF